MEAIQTKYLGPTDTEGSRIEASCMGVSVTVPVDYELNKANQHRKAAYAMIFKLDWSRYGPVVGGWVGDTMVFVFSRMSE